MQDGWTALIAAAKEGFTDVVSLLLENAAKYNIGDLVAIPLQFIDTCTLPSLNLSFIEFH